MAYTVVACRGSGLPLESLAASFTELDAAITHAVDLHGRGFIVDLILDEGSKRPAVTSSELMKLLRGQ